MIPDDLFPENADQYALYALLFLVGMLMGANPDLWRFIRNLNWKILMVPLLTMPGTLLAVSVFYLFAGDPGFRDILAIGSGFGYYSLSSILITEFSGEEIGVIALMSNIFRELITLIFAPLIVRFFGPLSLVLSGGATSMDTTLPVITRYSGTGYAVPALIHGMVLTFLVPLIISFLYNI